MKTTDILDMSQKIMKGVTKGWVEETDYPTNPKPPTPNELAKAFVNKKLSIDLTKTPEDVFAAYWKLKETEPIDDSELEIAVTTVLEENPNAVDKYKAGEEQVLGFFMGQIIRKIGKKVDPQLVRATLIEKLTETMGE